MRVHVDAGPELLARCERTVELARRRGAEEAEVYAEMGAALDVEIGDDRITASNYDESHGFGVRVVQAGKVGFAYATQPEDLDHAIADALAALRPAPGTGYHLPEGARPRSLGGRWNDVVAALEAKPVATAARDLLLASSEAAPDATVSGGGVGHAWGISAIASSRAVAAWDRSTAMSASASLVLEEGGRSLSAADMVSRHGLLEASDVGRSAAHKLLSLRGPREATAGAFDIVLSPEACAELPVALASSAALGDEAMRERSPWTGKLGHTVADHGFHLVDDPLAPGAVGAAPFDDEGLPARRLPVVEGGVLENFLFDSWDGHRHGRPSTRNGFRAGYASRPATGTHHVVVSHDTTRGLEDLLASVDDGYLVDTVLGAHTANDQTGEFSVTAPNVWRIRRGALDGATKDIALAGTLATLLAGAAGASREVKAMDGLRAPNLLVRGVSVSV